MKSGIYLITNKINGKKYVGQSVNIEQRWRTYKAHGNKNTSCRLISRAIQKYGIENFEFSILEIVSQEDLFMIDTLNEREKFWIKELDSIVDHKKGYNLTYGGDSHGTWSLESRRKISESHKKVIHTPEWNKNMGNSKRGVPNPKAGLTQKGVPCPNRGRPGQKKNSKIIRPIKATNRISGEEIFFSRTCECCFHFIGDRENTWLIRKLASGSLPVYKTSKWRHLFDEWKFEYC